MFRRVFFIATTLVLISGVYAQNSYPIILIHGFLGWGRDEMAGYYYWGGRTDIEALLREDGFEVYTVSVGPVSPNFDRAIEAFYQIKGGQVDYGNEKAQRLGIIQRPANKNYVGLYPRWDTHHPIHIISHSQGGQTARMLEMLLKTTFYSETSPLLSNKYTGWIKSVTTISTPHNGSTLVPIMKDVFPFVHNLAPWFGGINVGKIDVFYSFDLEHWGVKKNSDESLKEYYSRLGNSPLSNPRNLCSWDLSPSGSDEFNEKYETDEDVYYFSFATYATKIKDDKNTHKPDSEMSIHLWSTAMLLGQYSASPDSSWFENDGVVNTISMSHPHGSPFILYDKTPTKGKWQLMPRLHMDHQRVIGHLVSNKEMNDVIGLYNNHSRLLYSLK